MSADRRRGEARGATAAAQQVAPETLREREGRLRRPIGLLAIVGGLLPVAGLILEQTVFRAAPSDPARLLSAPRAVFERAAGRGDGQALAAARQVAIGEDWLLVAASAVLSALGLLAVAGVVWFVAGAAAGRRTEPVGILRWLAPVGVALYAVGDGVVGVLDALVRRDLAADPRIDYGRVVEQFDQPTPVALQVVFAALAALFAVGIVWTSLQAMTAGLFTRFLGLIGVFIAIVAVLPLLVSPTLQLDQFGILRAFWVVAIGVLLLGRWPRGEPPAWAAGEARPWPSRAQMLEELERERAKDRSGDEDGGDGDDDDPAPRKPGSGGRRRRKR